MLWSRNWLVGSMVINLLLGAAYLRRGADDSTGGGARPFRAPAEAATAPARDAGLAAPSAAAARVLETALAAPDLAGLRDLLAAAGMPADLRQEWLRAVLHNRYESRFRALMPDFERQALQVWWRDPDYSSAFSGRAGLEAELVRERLQAEIDAQLARLTGRDVVEAELGENPWIARDYAGLPPAKARELRRLELDYQEMENAIRRETMGFEMEADHGRLRLLEAEKQRDLAALLDPAERAAWELRASPAAQQAREIATRYGSDEAEYRRIYELVRERDRLRGEGAEQGFSDEERSEVQTQADASFAASLRGLVGEARAAEVAKKADHDYDTARLAVERLGLAPGVADRIHAVRGPVEAGLRKLAEDPALDEAGFVAGARALAEAARARVVAELGVEGARAYFERGAMSWLENLERGEPVFFTPEGARPGRP